VLSKAQEKLICKRFEERSSLLISRPAGDKIGTLLLMQHYGIPTRLLDWSDSLSIALSFALEQYSEEPTIWVLNASALNQANKSLARSKMIDSFDLGCHDYARYAFAPAVAPESSTNDVLPLAFKPLYQDARMHVQRSRFTIHGTSPESLDSQVRGLEWSGGPILHKIIVKLGARREKLNRLKLDNSILYPDREGLVRHLRSELENDPMLLGVSLGSK
jgi:hypothetical protein